MNHSKRAGNLFSTKLNCAQSVLAVYGPEYGIEEKLSFKLMEAFGGGIAHKGNLCGAIIGGLAVLGLKYGRDDITDIEKRNRTDQLAKDLMRKFEEKFQSINCMDLINYDISTPEKLEEARNRNIFKNCRNYVKTVIKLIEEF